MALVCCTIRRPNVSANGLTSACPKAYPSMNIDTISGAVSMLVTPIDWMTCSRAGAIAVDANGDTVPSKTTAVTLRSLRVFDQFKGL